MQFLETKNKKERFSCNEKNDAFYTALEAKGLQQIAEKAALATGCDLHLLESYWSKAKSILEVGAGYGRVINYLLQQHFQGKITAIEKNSTFFKYLTEHFNQYANVHLLQGDILYSHNITERFDLILYMWSGIADFPPREQLEIIKKLKKLLQENGHLIIDTIPANIIPINSKQIGANAYLLEINNNASHLAHSLTKHEIESYAAKANFSNVCCIHYKTAIGRKRISYILS
jgi:phospholipid N-methyltransferase